jgi:hypothetical protein
MFLYTFYNVIKVYCKQIKVQYKKKNDSFHIFYKILLLIHFYSHLTFVSESKSFMTCCEVKLTFKRSLFRILANLLWINYCNKMLKIKQK